MDTSKAFWSWFQMNEQRIARAYDAGDSSLLDDLLSERVALAASGAGWEIGPYALPLNAFVVSPGKRELVAVCRDLVAAAPAIPGWSFFAGKPPKDLRSLTIEISGHEVCADQWHYRLTSYGGGEFVDLELFYEECDSPAPVDAELAGELLVEALIGEAASLERVGDIQLALVSKVGSVERSTPLRYLNEHLNEVLAPLQ